MSTTGRNNGAFYIEWNWLDKTNQFYFILGGNLC